MEQMEERAWKCFSRCLFFTAFFLVFGCLAILEGRLELADTFRQLSSIALLGATILPPCLSS